jgi:hypothetical protein
VLHALAQTDLSPRVQTDADRDNFDPPSGTAKQCYVVTRDDIRYGEKPGIDPVAGRECRPLTAEVIERLRAYKWGNRPKRIEVLIRPSSAFAPVSQLCGTTKVQVVRYNSLI